MVDIVDDKQNKKNELDILVWRIGNRFTTLPPMGQSIYQWVLGVLRGPRKYISKNPRFVQINNERRYLLSLLSIKLCFEVVV